MTCEPGSPGGPRPPWPPGSPACGPAPATSWAMPSASRCGSWDGAPSSPGGQLECLDELIVPLVTTRPGPSGPVRDRSPHRRAAAHRRRGPPRTTPLRGRLGAPVRCRSMGVERPAKTTCPRMRAPSAALVTSLVLPIPASPMTTAQPPRPPAAWLKISASAASSSSRPTTTGHRMPGIVACAPAQKAQPGRGPPPSPTHHALTNKAPRARVAPRSAHLTWLTAVPRSAVRALAGLASFGWRKRHSGLMILPGKDRHLAGGRRVTGLTPRVRPFSYWTYGFAQ
jgi:hypothetical protein